MKITVDDARRAGFCLQGLKSWAEENGYDYRDMIKNGVSAEKLEATGHGGIVELVKKVKET